MMLIALIAVLTVAVAAAVVMPLMRRPAAVAERAAFDRAVYRDQLKELERDVARGLIATEEAHAARLEIERRLLAADAGVDAAAPRDEGLSPRLALALALLLPMTALVLYLALGAPDVPDQPYAARGPERTLASASGPVELDKEAAALTDKLKANPENDAEWLRLAQVQAALGHWQKSAEAYREALRITKGRPDVAAAYGEMLVMAADGIVTPGARDAFTAALGRDPKNMAARYYLGLAEAQQGNTQAAVDAWQRLLTDLPPTSELRGELEARIAEAARAGGLSPPQTQAEPPAPGPSAADMAQAGKMSAEDRQKMIASMVERLAAKLEEKPDDLDGWLRLGRAYGVMGDRDKAADAYEHAALLKPDDPSLLIAEGEALLPDRQPQTPVPERVVTLMKRAETLDPKQPMALWYLGLAAAQQRRFADATGYWQRLSNTLPADSEQQKAVTAALEAIKGK
jgi:cytochrome c-type biogenesis protein CcmH